MSKSKDLFGVCPYFTAQKVLASKWSMYLLYLLSEHEGIRFNELLRLMPEDMTHTTLSRQLKSLEDYNMIVRKDYQQIPPRVEYSLSDIGEEFRPLSELGQILHVGKSGINHRMRKLLKIAEEI